MEGGEAEVLQLASASATFSPCFHSSYGGESPKIATQ